VIDKPSVVPATTSSGTTTATLETKIQFLPITEMMQSMRSNSGYMLKFAAVAIGT
jgi:hypothetical protein